MLAGLGDDLVGIRHQVHDEPDPRWLLRADVQQGLADGRGTRLGLRPARSRGRAPCRAKRPCDETPASASSSTTWRNRRCATGATDAWAEGLAALAAFPNVVCKLSGLVTEAEWSSWRKDELVAVLRRALDWFGPDRCLFGSDWPVCLLAADYGAVLDLVESAVAELTADERAAVLGGNAIRVYGLGR